MDCKWFQNRIDSLLNGSLNHDDREIAQNHLFDCDACNAIMEKHLIAPPDLAVRVLEATPGSSCSQAQDLLAAYIDQPMQDLQSGLIDQHLVHCEPCSAILETMVSLEKDLTAMATLATPERLTQNILAATSRKRIRKPWSPQALTWWQSLIRRPRFAMEAAYILAIVAFFAFRLSPSVQTNFALMGEAFTAIASSTSNTTKRLDGQIENLATHVFSDLSSGLAKTQSGYQKVLTDMSQATLTGISNAVPEMPTNIFQQPMKALQTIWTKPTAQNTDK